MLYKQYIWVEICVQKCSTQSQILHFLKTAVEQLPGFRINFKWSTPRNRKDKNFK